jgi:S-adenosylmethionine-diacylglycerol 3-amino-3-carboxypropyl transferase
MTRLTTPTPTSAPPAPSAGPAGATGSETSTPSATSGDATGSAIAPAVAARADFTAIRYAQCWEDADILVEALAPQPGHTLVSICSAGDNTLALLTGTPARVVAVDLSAAQIACLELRVAAYRALSHDELLQLVGSRPARDRRGLYARCRSQLSSDARAFWDAHGDAIDAGIGGAGKFERYFAAFRARVLPLVHSRSRVEQLLAGGPTREARERFYEDVWNSWRWRAMFQLFFSRFVMGRLGRDPEFFAHVEGSVATRILQRTRHALTALDPADNPYIHWILRGTHGAALPMALRAEHFETIRDHLDRLTWRQSDVAAALDDLGDGQVHGANLSDIFEYMSPDETRRQLERLSRALAPSGRLAYWNMLAPRSRPDVLADRLRPLPELSARLFAADKAFFYSAFVVEERC